MSAPAIVQPIVARLDAAKATIGALAVDAAGDLIAAAEQLKADRSLVVMWTGESGGPNELATAATQQRLSIRFAVYAGLKHAGAIGQFGALAAETLRHGLIGQLVGWRHSSFADATPTEYRGAQLADFDMKTRLMFWRFDFSFSHWVRQ